MKKRINFFELLESQCESMCNGMEALHNYCSTFDEAYGDKVIQIEDEGDMIRRILIDEINKAFITPIERKDLFDLSRLIDEILDYAKTTVDGIRIFKIAPNEDMASLTKILLEMTTHIKKAVANIEKHKSIARDEAIKVKRLENVVGSMSTESLATLFEVEDFRNIFKYRELYRHLNQTADIADEAMDYLLDILVCM